MANAEVRLKVSKSAYEEKIAMLKDYLNELDRTLQAYDRKKTEMDSFIDGSSDGYEEIKKSVEQNQKSVGKAKEMCNNSIKMLEDTLKEMEDFGQNILKTAEAATEAAGAGLKTAFQAMNTLG